MTPQNGLYSKANTYFGAVQVTSSQSSMEKRIREGFPNQRLVVLPDNILKRCRKLPLVNQLYVTDIGSYPSAPFHYVRRQPGIPQAIMIGCLSGIGEVQLDQAPIQVRPGHVLLIPPHQAHIYQADEQDPWSIFWVHFGGHSTQAVLTALGVSQERPLVFVPDMNQVRGSFEEVYACLNYHYSDSGLLAMSSELMRLIGKIKLLRGSSVAKFQSANTRIQETIHFMEQHLDMLIKLKDFAAHAGQSVSYFSKLFKQRTGQSPMNYFIQLKVQKACRLLDQTDLSVIEISQQLGYEDPYYFSRLFKKVQGRSPANYRKMIKG